MITNDYPQLDYKTNHTPSSPHTEQFPFISSPKRLPSAPHPTGVGVGFGGCGSERRKIESAADSFTRECNLLGAKHTQEDQKTACGCSRRLLLKPSSCVCGVASNRSFLLHLLHTEVSLAIWHGLLMCQHNTFSSSGVIVGWKVQCTLPMWCFFIFAADSKFSGSKV